MTDNLSKDQNKKLNRFYNTHAEQLDTLLDATNRAWWELTIEQQKQLYKQYTGEDL